ncbi:MAG: hypothetical protein ACLUOI_13690 [Eisenbergiella sp.]
MILCRRETAARGSRRSRRRSAGAGEEAQRAALAERTRIREITGLCARFGIDSEQFISRGIRWPR